MKIFVCDPVGPDGIDYLKEKGHEMVDDIAVADAFIVRGKTKVTKEMMAMAKNLKVIARSGTGVDNIDLVAARKKNIVVVNAPGANAESVAEHTLAFMLALARSLVPAVNTLKSGIWAKSDFRGMELSGKTLVVLGAGHIGLRVAELGRAFGMEVLVFTRGDVLGDMLPKADFITIHLPLNDETRGMIGAGEFSRMKTTAYLINTARGALIDEQALVLALKNGVIAGAALDVFTKEPLSSESELLKLENVILTPHVAADSREGENRASMMIAQDVDAVLQGKFPKNSL